MTANRDKDADKKATLKILQSINKGKIDDVTGEGISWLGHRDAGGDLDRLLAFGATMEQLEGVRDAVLQHFAHLAKEHGLKVINVAGTHRISVPKN